MGPILSECFLEWTCHLEIFLCVDRCLYSRKCSIVMSSVKERVILGKVRIENAKSQKKEPLGQNHRVNYLKSSQSNIFDNRENERHRGRSQDDKSIQENIRKVLDPFVPKYRERSAMERKAKEFNPTYKISQFQDEMGQKRTASASDIKTIDVSTLIPREKKIIEQYPQLTKEDLQSLASNSTTNTQSRNDKNQYLTAKTTLISSLYSNIFHDPNKKEDDYIRKSNNDNDNNQSAKKKDNYNSLNKKRQCPQSRIHSSMDWKYTNTELAF